MTAARPEQLVIRRWWPAIAGLVALGLAVAVGIHPEPLPGELGMVEWLQDVGEPVPWLAEGVRRTTGTEASLIVLVPLAVVVVRGGKRGGAATLAIALAAMLVVQPVLKEIVDRPRPDASLVDVRAGHESRSYPSGHSLSTTTVWGTIAGLAWLGRRRAWAGVAVAPVALTAVASGVQGVHWPTDALGGTAIGAVAAWASVRTVRRGEFPARDGAGQTADVTVHYREPGWLTRNVLNRAVAFATRHGLSLQGSRVLAVRGRSSGEWRTTPVNLLELEGTRYLVSARGEGQWVRNLRAAGGGEVRVGRDVEEFRARELGDDEKVPVLRAYLKRWKWEVGAFFEGVGPESSDEELRAIAHRHPAFELQH